MSFFRSIMFVVCISTLCVTANAEGGDSLFGSSEPRFFLGAGLSTGGDTLNDIEYTNGTSTTIKAGGFVNMWGGIVFDIPQYNMDFQTSIGFFIDDATASNGDVNFFRYPIEVLAFYKHDKVRVGGGITYHLSPEYDFTIESNSEGIEFDNALGIVLEMDFLLGNGYGYGPSMHMGVRFVSIDYEASSYTFNGITVPAEGTIDGNHVGFTFNYVF